jgi:hypothetical protein
MPLSPHPAMDALLARLDAGGDGDVIMDRCFEMLSRIGNGDTATVFAHPFEPDMVVRVTDYPDGWFAYAEAARDLEDPSPFAPLVHDIVHAHGIWLAVAERLQECPDTREETVLLKLARRVIFDTSVGCEKEDDVKALEQAQPGFNDFIVDTLLGARDLKFENFMRRGDTLVVNDPIRAMSCDQESRLAARYDIATRVPVADRIQAAPRDVDFDFAM